MRGGRGLQSEHAFRQSASPLSGLQLLLVANLLSLSPSHDPGRHRGRQPDSQLAPAQNCEVKDLRQGPRRRFGRGVANSACPSYSDVLPFRPPELLASAQRCRGSTGTAVRHRPYDVSTVVVQIQALGSSR